MGTLPVLDSDLTIQERVLRKWDNEWQERLKAHIQRIADEMGCTWWDIVMENRDLSLDEADETKTSARRTSQFIFKEKIPSIRV
jgi:hypothetical protein